VVYPLILLFFVNPVVSSLCKKIKKYLKKKKIKIKKLIVLEDPEAIERSI
jgi:hypothetical protein